MRCMSTSDATTLTIPQSMARLAALWVLRQAAPGTTLEHAGDTLAAWQHPTAMELALLPDAARMLAAATQELVQLLEGTPEGRNALREIGLTNCRRGKADWAA